LRNLAFLATEDGKSDLSADLLLQAARYAPQIVPLVQECVETLLRLNRPAQAAGLLKEVPPDVQQNGRIGMLRVRAGLALGDTSEAEHYFGSGTTVDDIREGEISVTDVWFQWQALLRSKETGAPFNEELVEQLRNELEPPNQYDFRLYSPPKEEHAPAGEVAPMST
jgi:hypothetical protein